ncbi:O-antigen ligase family protein [Salinibacterium sp. NG253]|uniref:O-antigen ligase family protein n=1 Tax=Salinibacterium sp. NG253 TaxID=2792039 RepID=UPI0018CE3EF4|nr:O-antigen ligase family protein [Salinibacterium sp. NG253]MBH0116113.1 O-antigen ligase family protein [Salinibacterium sp. NG253]
MISRSALNTATNAGAVILSSPRTSAALSTVVIGTTVAAFFLRTVLGTPGFLAALVLLVVLVSLSAWAQWKDIGWRALVPISLILFTGWVWLSVAWSQYRAESVASALYLLMLTIMGIYIALVRDTIQIVRAFGDVLRAALVVSLVFEILTGLIFDSSLDALLIQGNLGTAEPIQGIFGTRNHLGMIALIAFITFAIEYSTRSVERNLAIGSLITAALVLLLSQSPLALGAGLIIAAATGALVALRRVPSGRRRYWQILLMAFTAATLILSWLSRTTIVAWFDASDELAYRVGVWRQLWTLEDNYRLEGWGWIGPWDATVAPYLAFRSFDSRVPDSAHNAYLDVWFQLGVVGFLIFVGLLGLAFTRSWLLASRRRSIVFAWPALVLLALAIGALAESSILTDFGWLTFVVCCVKASRELSWRRALDSSVSPGI